MSSLARSTPMSALVGPSLIVLFVLSSLTGCQLSRRSGDQGQEPGQPEVGLHRAAASGDLDQIRAHIAAGSDLNSRIEGGPTALFLAAVYQHEEAAILLVRAGADVNIRENKVANRTPLFFAARFGKYELVELLLEHGADPNLQDDSFGKTALIEAADWGYAEVVRLLIEKGADTEIKDRIYGGTALYWAADRGQMESVKALLQGGADPNAADINAKKTPLHRAIDSGHTEIADLLRVFGGKD